MERTGKKRNGGNVGAKSKLARSSMVIAPQSPIGSMMVRWVHICPARLSANKYLVFRQFKCRFAPILVLKATVKRCGLVSVFGFPFFSYLDLPDELPFVPPRILIVLRVVLTGGG